MVDFYVSGQFKFSWRDFQGAHTGSNLHRQLCRFRGVLQLPPADGLYDRDFAVFLGSLSRERMLRHINELQ